MAEIAHNINIVIPRIARMADGFESFAQETIEDAMNEDVMPIWHEHISLEDHSLEDLRKLGHPYSTRFAADSFMHPDSEVHEQDGGLIEGSKIEIRPGEVSLINDSPEYVFLRYGTETMRIRDPGGATIKQALPLIMKRFYTAFQNAFIQFFTS